MTKPAFDRGRTRAPCSTCDREIPRGELRVGVPVSAGRVPNATLQYHHVECAVTTMPRTVREALIADASLVPDPTQLNQRLQTLIEDLEDEPEPPPPPKRVEPLPPPDRELEPLLEQLELDPSNRGHLAVIADVLLEKGDPRGELISLELAGGSSHRIDQLRAAVLPKLAQFQGLTLRWGIGYVDRVELYRTVAPRLARVQGSWKHPSLRFVTELKVDHLPEYLGADDLRCVHRLELGAFVVEPPPRVAAVLAQRPRLRELVVSGSRIERIEHASLVKLQLDPGTSMAVLPTALPALRELVLVGYANQPRNIGLERLQAVGPAILPQLASLSLVHFEIDAGAVRILREHLGEQRLAKLDLSAARAEPAIVDQLRELCGDLVPPRAQLAAGAPIKHAKWGAGTVRRIIGNKLEIDFGEHGVKTFAADSPSLER